MPTTITAVPETAGVYRDARVRLDVTGAPNQPATAYTSNFATVDGWTAGTAAVSAVTTVTPNALYVRKAYPAVANTAYSASRTVTGLTVGTVYRYRAAVSRKDSGQVRLSVVGSTTGAWVSTSFPVTRAFTEITFTATATSHTIRVEVQWTGSPTGGAPGYYVDSITVAPVSAWLGTTITRTDANGTKPVRLAIGQDTVAGAMTVYDFEAALIGAATYTVTDGLGATATVTCYPPEYRRNCIANPAFADGTTTGWFTNASLTMSAFSTAGPNPEVATSRVMALTVNTDLTNNTQIAVPTTTPATPGSYWSVRLSMRDNTAAVISPIVVQTWAFDSAGTSIGVVDQWTYTPTSAWGVASFAAATPMPAGTAQCRIYIRNSGTAGWLAGTSVYLSGFSLEQVSGPGVYIPDYFDGDTVGDGGTTQYLWTGTPKVSQSVMVSPLSAPGAWLAAPATGDPSTGSFRSVKLESVLAYDETNQSNGTVHTIIDRADPIANPGPLSLRSGQLELWVSSYANLRILRGLMGNGETIHLRQPDHVGLDMYFVPSRVTSRPIGDNTPTRWSVTLAYDEVAQP